MLIWLLLILGLALGSFVNALVWRLHEQAKKRKSTPNLSIIKGRSICPHCKHQLASKDLLPIISWFWLKGRCRYCHKPISPQYPLVEAGTALLFVLSYLSWPHYPLSTINSTLDFVFWLGFLTGLVAIAVYDIRWMLIPNKIVYPLIIIATLQFLFKIVIFESSPSTLINTILSVAVAGGLFYGLFQVSQGKWIGGGDVKLGFLLGLILSDPILSMMMIFIASLLGLAVTAPLLFTGRLKLKARIPFGPLLIAATIIVKLFGPSLLNWYETTFLTFS